jgi:hypothetical protein
MARRLEIIPAVDGTGAGKEEWDGGGRFPATVADRRYGDGGDGSEGQRDGSAGFLPDFELAAMLRCRVRYFTDGAVIGSKAFVNDVFAAARERFTEKRKEGARRMKGSGKAAAGVLWSARDLRVRLG